MKTSYYSGDGLGFQHLGQDAPPVPTTPEPAPAGGSGGGLVGTLAAIGGTLSMPVLAYHGYKRNDSVGWAIVWGLFGSWVWPITVPIALAQGYAKPARRVQANRRRRSSRRRRTSRSAR